MADPVQVLMDMKDETVSARYIAPIVKTSPGALVKYAKDGTWDQERNGGFVISGEGPNARVKFKRLDFLQKWGFIEPKKEEPSMEQQILKQLKDLNEGVTLLCQMLTLMMEPFQLDALQELIDKKTADAATPTD